MTIVILFDDTCVYKTLVMAAKLFLIKRGQLGGVISTYYENKWIGNILTGARLLLLNCEAVRLLTNFNEPFVSTIFFNRGGDHVKE